ncbi:alpha/beta fold hydrolase [Brevundimonas sp.]|jgi:pimeloyl-ACP methyl ester carboxylesterase|uniref:alpha/beta fold hydrolase n=1 Tax=Brevundimonas sp. TaxID=1871086 RepID=UPI00378328E0
MPISAAAPPLFLPGLLCDARIWAGQLEALAAFNPVVASYGLSRSLTEMAEVALAAAPPRFSLIGHSMGARVALEIHRQAPERIERLALLDTGVHPPQPGEAEKRYALLDLGKREGVDRMVDVWLPPMVHPDRQTDPTLIGPLHAMATSMGLSVFEAQIEALLGRPDATPLLSSIEVPTLVGVGRQDVWSPLAQHQDIAARIHGATLCVFEDSGHMSPVEAADAVTSALLQWLLRA